MNTTELKNLLPGHEFPEGSLNCRTVGRTDELAPLAASIKAEGLLQALLVCRANDDQLYVVDGNRRLAALNKLREESEIDGDYQVAIIITDFAGVDEALRKSLAANEHLPLHPVDRYETFAKIHSEGANVPEIAARYGISNKLVKQSLALGKLAPAVREAWRNSEIDAETAQDFTLSTDHEEQEKVLKGYKKSKTLDVRRALIGNQSDVNRFMKYVGRDAYIAAGGSFVEELFSDKDSAAVSDFSLLKKCVIQKLEAKCDQLIEQGWSWADGHLSPNYKHMSWARVKAGGKATKEEKAKAGCIVMLGHDGQIEISYVIKPAEKKEDKKHSTATEVPKEFLPWEKRQLISNLLNESVSAQVEGDENLALSILLAALQSNWDNGPTSIDSVVARDGRGVAFEKALPGLVKLTQKEKLKEIVKLVGISIEFRLPLESVDKVLLQFVDKEKAAACICKNFDAKSYFKDLPESFMKTAAAELGVADKFQALRTQKDKEKLLVDQAKLQKWLPEDLRLVPADGNKPLKTTGATPSPAKAPEKKKAPAKKPAAKKK